MSEDKELRGINFEEGYVAVIDKPLRWTSADVVRKVKFTLRKAGYRKIKVGHAGTLDPLATGILLLCIGRATKMADALQAEEKEYVADVMLGATTLEDSISGVLRNIGVYYQADRVYVLTLAADRRVVTMPFEWDDPCKCSIQQVVSGMLLEKFPLLARCIEEKSPVFLERRQEIRHSGKDRERREDVWRFTTYPLFRHDRLDGFLCIENSRRYPTSAALFSTLIPYMLHEQERFSGGSGAAGTVEQLMGLPDLRSFMGTIYSLDGSRYSSLGAICLDIPGMAAINSSQGFEYGSRLLWYVSKTLTDIFGPSLLFRTWEAEFIAFCPNTTQQVFQGRCARLASILQRRYPRDIRIGSAWAEGTFTGRRLVDEARRNMHVQKPDVQLSKPPIIGAMQEHLEMAGEPESRPLVHFQPIVDMRTGRILAAEALVRGMDGDGNVIPPSRFIDMLERDGSIRELDLFVLDEALRQLDRWRSMGLGDMRVSVNLSRVTLLYPSTIASILAIQSRYPHLAPDSLELEITESSDVMGNREFGDLVDRLRSALEHMGWEFFQEDQSADAQAHHTEACHKPVPGETRRQRHAGVDHQVNKAAAGIGIRGRISLPREGGRTMRVAYGTGIQQGGQT